MTTDSIVQLVLALVPFVALFGGFLIFHWGSLKTVFITCIIEFAIVILYFKSPPLHATEAAIWEAWRCGRLCLSHSPRKSSAIAIARRA